MCHAVLGGRLADVPTPPPPPPPRRRHLPPPSLLLLCRVVAAECSLQSFVSVRTVWTLVFVRASALPRTDARERLFLFVRVYVLFLLPDFLHFFSVIRFLRPVHSSPFSSLHDFSRDDGSRYLTLLLLFYPATRRLPFATVPWDSPRKWTGSNGYENILRVRVIYFLCSRSDHVRRVRASCNPWSLAAFFFFFLILNS